MCNFGQSGQSAAEQQAQADAQRATEVTLANRPDQVTPFGTQSWEMTGGFDEAGYNAALAEYNQAVQDSPFGVYGITHDAPTQEQFTTPQHWQSTIELSPEQQALYESRTGVQQGLLDTAQSQLSQVQGALGEPFQINGQVPNYQGPQGDIQAYTGSGADVPQYSSNYQTPTYQGVGGNVPTYDGVGGNIPTYQGPQGELPSFQSIGGSVPTYEGARQSVMDAMMSRIQSDAQNAQQSAHDKLVAQGIPPGSEAYQRQMEMLSRQENDAVQQAEIAATQMATQEFQNQMASRGMTGAEAQQLFQNQMASRQQGGTESQQQFQNEMSQRRQQLQENQNQFLNDLESRGIQRQEAMDLFDNAMRSSGMDRQRALDQFSTSLASYGISRQEAMDLFNTNMQLRDQQMQEGLTEYQTGMSTHQQNIQDELLQRQVPMNELLSMLTGAPLQMPQFAPSGQMPYTPGPDYLGAYGLDVQQQIAAQNAQQSADNAFTSGLFRIGSSLIGG